MRRLAVLLALLVPAGAGAVEFSIARQPLRLDVTESLFLNLRLDPGNGDPLQANYGEVINRLNAQLAWKQLLFGMRIDTALYTADGGGIDFPEALDAPKVGDTLVRAHCRVDPMTRMYPPGCQNTIRRESDLFVQGYRRYRQTPYDPRKFFEKVFLTYTGRSVDATLGDFYVNFGRGLVLSIRKVDELGVDTTLFGGKVAVRRGGFSGMAVAGFTNIQNIDEPTSTYMPDPFDFVGGLRVDYRILNRVIVGAHGVGGAPNMCALRDPENPTACGARDQDVRLRYGATVEIPRLFPWLSLYAEYARADDRISGKPRDGNAFYGAATAYAGDATWLLEFKLYDRFQPWLASTNPFGNIVYTQPPTLERVQTQLTNNSDIVAARVRVDYRVGPSLLLFGSAQAGRLHPTPESTHSLVDFYGGAQLRWNGGRSYLFPTLGYRNEHKDNLDPVAGGLPTPAQLPHTEEQLFAIELDGAQGLPKGMSIETQGLVWLRQKGLETTPGAGDNAWTEGYWYLAFKWTPRIIATGGIEFTTQPNQLLSKHVFLNAALQWNITPATSIRVFYGGQRPGLRCVSGVCRVFPAFEGAKVEVIVRF